MDLGQVVVGQQEVDLTAVIRLELGGPVERLPAFLRAVGVEALAVDQLLQDQMPLRVVSQVGGFEQFVEVAAMIVHVAGDPHFPLGRKRHDLLIAQRVDLVFLGRRAERLHYLVGSHRHGKWSMPSGGFRQYFLSPGTPGCIDRGEGK